MVFAPTGAVRAQAGVGPNEIVIGQNITLQGGKNVYGAEIQAGVQTLLQEVNRAGGVFGRRVVLRTLDDENQGAKAEANAKQLVDSGVFILFGSIEGGPSTAVMKVAADRQIPFFGPMAGSPELRRPHQPQVFPVRAEHREEFRALIAHASSIGLRRVGFFHADSGTGQLHLENVKRAAAEVNAEVVLAAPFKSDITDAQLDTLVEALAKQKVDVMINHGSPSTYEKLIRKAKASGVRTQFFAVNSGSTGLARSLGDLSHGMVFAQVVPNPFARKTALAREYQDAYRKAFPDRDFSYGSLEGYLTAKALVGALRLAGAQPTRASFVRGLKGVSMDLGGMKISYEENDHVGSTFVDLSIVTRTGSFLQ